MNCPNCNHFDKEDARFCGGCGGDLEKFASEYDRPDSIVQYREALTEFLDDKVLDDWEKDALATVRETLKISTATHDRLVEEMGGTADAPIPVAVYLDTAQIKKFHVGGNSVFSFWFENKADQALRSVELAFRDTEFPGEESLSVKTKPIGPGLDAQQQKVTTLHQSGAHELTGEISVVSLLGEIDQFEFEPIPYDLGRDSDTPTQVNIDQRNLRVADISGMQVGSTSAQSGVVSDRSWLPLKLTRVATALRAEEEKRRQEAEEARRVAEAEAAEKARKEADDARRTEEERQRQEAEAAEKAQQEAEVERQRLEAEAEAAENARVVPVRAWQVEEKRQRQEAEEKARKEAEESRRVEEEQKAQEERNRQEAEAAEKSRKEAEQASGFQTLELRGGLKYFGEVIDGEAHGQGTITWPDGQTYTGEVQDGNPHGQGSENYASGNKYIGEFNHGKKHGHGTQVSADGEKRLFVIHDKGKRLGGRSYKSSSSKVASLKTPKRRPRRISKRQPRYIMGFMLYLLAAIISLGGLEILNSGWESGLGLVRYKFTSGYLSYQSLIIYAVIFLFTTKRLLILPILGGAAAVLVSGGLDSFSEGLFGLSQDHWT